MTFFDDLLAARARVDAAKAELASAQAALTALEAQSMKGGPDISEFQGDIDWTKVVTVADTVFVRVSDGDHRDARYTAGRVTSLRTSGVAAWFPYHYCRVAADSNGQRTARTEAAMAYYFAASMGWGASGDLPLAYDVEKNAGETTTFQGQSPAKALAHVLGFIAAYKALAGQAPIIYSNPDTLTLLLGAATVAQRSALLACPLWIANWGVATPTVPAGGSAYFHQYTDAATYPGITGAVDGNRVLVTRSAVEALRIAP